MIRNKIYFVSDVHLGAKALNNNKERELLFIDWLNQISSDAKQIFILGDLFDFWFEYKSVIPRGYSQTLGKLAELSNSGIDIHFFVGNHDIWASDFFKNELGITVHYKEEIWNINGKKILLAHGDGLDHLDKGYIFLRKLFTNKFLQWCYSILHPNFAHWIAHKWSSIRRKKHQIKKVSFKGEENEGLFIYAKNTLKNTHIDIFIFGHRHLLLDLPLNNNSRFIILGDWISYFSYGVFDGKEFSLKTKELKLSDETLY